MLLPALAVPLRQAVAQVPDPGQGVHHGPLGVQHAVHGLVVVLIPAHAVILHHHAVALPGPLHRVAPGEVQPLPGLTAHLGHALRMPADLL